MLQELIKRYFHWLWVRYDYLRALSASPEFMRYRKGELTYMEAVDAFNRREQEEHEAEMERMKKEKWVLEQQIALVEKKCGRLEQDLSKALKTLPNGLEGALRGAGLGALPEVWKGRKS